MKKFKSMQELLAYMAGIEIPNELKISDIDWSKSIPEIDQQLYAKYNLTEEEISFIESMIKPME